MTNYYPKGGRCSACQKAHDDCSDLPFHTMPVHRRDGADVVVICNEFRQANHDASLKAGGGRNRR
ncbi:hypothetical protein E8E95_05560 [Pseudomonas sp. BN414]|uniref:hypothetical protein n=1 Tax=Pseudomonas sp. BN414 TaxID=2567888 RepID=UPI002458E16C|nr:hypothetical protein [Pseudomonas sp. BN414]MDH4566139.1 hypothetical protein [Pseudomonas sp. BN414]